MVDRKIYYQTRGGEMRVMAAGDAYQPLAVNRVTNESEEFSATPAVSDGSICIRSHKHLPGVAQQP